MLPPDSRYGVQPLRSVQAVRNLPIQRRYCRRWNLFRIRQFSTIGRAKVCGEINKAIGASLQPVKREPASNGAQSLDSGRGVLVVNLDPDGPSARAGMLVGDIVTAWDGRPIDRVREIMRLLGPESVGRTVDLSLIRGGAPAALKVVIGERPVK